MIPNQWYAILESGEVKPGKPVGVTRMGEKLVLWRDEKGQLQPLDVKAGDRVLFGKWSGTEVKIDGVEYLIMKESDIMGVIEQTVARKKAA